jgi:hypothetical protein
VTNATNTTTKCPDEEYTLHQHIRFNLLRHRGVESDIPTLQLFREFTTALRVADPMLTILPYEASKQHYSSINTSKQIQALDAQKFHKFFRSYYQRQLYYLSRFFHICTALTFQDLTAHNSVAEWLDTYQYYVKLCPSQHEEMVQVGGLCYSNVLMHHEELKQVIMKHPIWNYPDPQPIFDVYVSNFIADNKKAKMLFVLAEKSQQDKVVEFFKQVYNGSPKAYPNGSMMIFIPLRDGTSMSTEYRSKILFNHDNFNGTQKAMCIGGLQDLNNKITLSTGNTITLRELLKSFPASPGMSRPFLFQQVEHNASSEMLMVAYQKADAAFIKHHQGTLESDIRRIIANGEVRIPQCRVLYRHLQEYLIRPRPICMDP